MLAFSTFDKSYPLKEGEGFHFSKKEQKKLPIQP